MRRRRFPLPAYVLLVFTPLIALLLIPLSFGGRLEAALRPVLVHQDIPLASVQRTGDHVCWIWIRDKLRAPKPIELDVELTTSDGDRGSTEVFDAKTGAPWHRAGAREPGHHETRYCARIPGFVRPSVSFRIRQTIEYEGLWDLWTIRVTLPDVTAAA